MRLDTDQPSIVVLSGGQDSATSAVEHHEVVERAVFFDYGQRHVDPEIRCATWWATELDVPLHIIKVPSIKALQHSALTAAGDITANHDLFPDLPASFVPGRNLLLLTLAASLAVKHGLTSLITGVCQTDYSGYPDCRAETMYALELALSHGIGIPITIVTPQMYRTKAQTFKVAYDHDALEDVLEHTHTCYNGDHKTRHEWGYGCDDCPACAVRKKGYQEYLTGSWV